MKLYLGKLFYFLEKNGIVNNKIFIGREKKYFENKESCNNVLKEILLKSNKKSILLLIFI